MAAGAENGLKLLGFWASPYVVRVQWALKLKEIQYEYLEEDLSNKSPFLLQYNPVHKKVPVLVHRGKPLVESLVILEYIDEMWKQNPLLPQDPYQRAMARFWANFVDTKCATAVVGTFSKVGEEQEKAAKEARKNLKTLESGLKEGKPFFGGETIGFMDIVAGWIGCWARIVEEIVGIKLLSSTPLLYEWSQNFLEVPIIKECMPSPDKLLLHYKNSHKCVPAVMGTFSKVGEEQEKSAKEARENLKMLESGLEGKCFFGGETIGFVDIAAGWLGCWTRIVEEIVGMKLIDEETMPLLNAWFQNFLEVPIIKECLPPRDKLLEHNKGFHDMLIAAST